MSDDESKRVAAAKRKVEGILRKAAPRFKHGNEPLNKLAIYLSNAPWQDWQARENGFPDVDKRLEKIEKIAEHLLEEIQRAQFGPDALRVPGGGDWSILRMRAATQPVRDLASQMRRERDGLPKGEWRDAWKGWAHIFYDLVVQTWLEGGEPFWRDTLGTQRNFGIHPRGKATLAVQGLLALAMKDHPHRNPPSADTISELLTTLPDPLPWVYEPTGVDLHAYTAGDWDYDGLRRLNLKKPESKRKSSENIEQKKRGRPRGK